LNSLQSSNEWSNCKKYNFMSIDISVIIPIFNVEAYIEKCLSSIINQRGNFSFELILVNDKTEDNSIIKAKEFLEINGKHIVWTIIDSKVNGGLSYARNQGIVHSKGEFLYFLDSDDYVDNDILEKLFEPIRKDNTIEIVIGNGLWHKKNGEIVPIRDIKNYTNYVSSKDILKGLYSGKFPAYIWLNLFKKSVFNKVNFPEGVVWEDLLTWPNILDRNRNIFVINDLLYHYLSREGSISERFDPRMYSLGEHLFEIAKSYDLFNDRAEYAEIFSFFYAKTFLELSWKVVFLSSGKSEAVNVLKEWAKFIPNKLLTTLFRHKYFKKFCLMALWKLNPSSIFLLWHKK
jgi:glycosyltransferase involved in cell wall biosynthesis